MLLIRILLIYLVDEVNIQERALQYAASYSGTRTILIIQEVEAFRTL